MKPKEGTITPELVPNQEPTQEPQGEETAQ